MNPNGTPHKLLSISCNIIIDTQKRQLEISERKDKSIIEIQDCVEFNKKLCHDERIRR